MTSQRDEQPTATWIFAVRSDMHDRDLIERWRAYCLAGGAAEATLRMRVHYLFRLAHHSDGLTTLTTDDLIEWMASHPDWSANTRKSVRSAIRAFYRWAVAAGHVNASPAESLPVVRVPRAVAKPTPDPAYRTALSERDERLVLMVRLGGQLGMRRGEIARARREDLEQGIYGWNLRVTGKGGHTRLIPCPDDLARLVLAHAPGWLFPHWHTGEHISAGYVGKLLSEALPAGYSGHSLRHRCATRAYDATRDLLAVQELLGHARPETTAGYIRSPDDSVRAAVMAAAA